MSLNHCMVGTVGLEPTRDILPTDFKSVASAYFATIPLEVPTRFELVITELQSIALPLGYGTIMTGEQSLNRIASAFILL